MIGSIDEQADIDLYLEKEEVNQPLNKIVEGVLIKIHKPKKQGTISISLNDQRKNQNGFGIGVEDKDYWNKQNNFHIDIFIGSEYYEILKNKGRIGTRQRIRDGSKINVYDLSKFKEGIEQENFDYLKYYRDNKDKLIEKLG